MENIYLFQLIDAVKGEFLLGDPHAPVTSVSTDTRTIHKVDYFFAIKGRNYDGHDHIKTAIDKQARGLIVSKKDIDLGKPFPYIPSIVSVRDTTVALGDFAAYYRGKFNIPVIGITGSNGKTTTKEMTATILQQTGPVLKNEGNFNNQIGLPMTLFNLNSEHKYAVLEMGTNSFGEIKRLSEIAAPGIAAITNIGLAHIETFKDHEGVLKEKSALFDSLDPKAWAVVNLDDPYIKKLIPSLRSNITTFGLTDEASVYASGVKLWPGKPEFTLNIGGRTEKIKLPVYGMYNVYNALCAAAIAWSAGVGPEMIKAGLENFVPPKMRMDIRNYANGAVLINDAYNANPSSMRESIKAFTQSFPDKDKIVVLADMLELGEKSKEEHTKLGEFIDTQPVSKIYLLGEMMANALEPLKHAKAMHFMKKEDLLAELRQSIPARSVVFFKGSRGMKLEEVADNLFPNEEII